ncbi:hypothetical protein HD600_001667 [Microbacterium ginsengiterrae]|uniref:DUF4192 family protein n=1 Tax=Microbacterium ginsengiterrae TaxID=546115 RepID=A0A7W9FBH2_9MICO|nr:DUF4192 family protein [Microbacterium ginsengiterrae]MBB5743170.1 hypothetical protein [Microbacterium ginsengiterrae]
MTTVLHASDPAQFLSLVPALAGFTPRRSLVLLPFAQSRAHGAMRMDLPVDRSALDEYVDAAIGLVSRVTGTEAIAVVVYSDDHPQRTPDGVVLPETVLVEELVTLAVASGLRIVDALCVMTDGWSCYLDDDPAVRTLSGIPAAPTVAGDVDPAVDQYTGGMLPPSDLGEMERVERALGELEAALSLEETKSVARVDPQAIAATLLLDDMPQFFESLIERPPDAETPFVTAALLWCLDRPAIRDAALLQWATDLPTGLRAWEAQLAFSMDGAAIPDDLGRMIIGQGPGPDLDRLRAALVVARTAAACAPHAFRPAPLTMAAWMSWALGRSTNASQYLEQARRIAPGYPMAHLLEALIDGAVLPEWAFRRGGRPMDAT